MIAAEDLANRFTYHAPSPDKVRLHEEVREAVHELAREFNASLPDGREKSLVMTHLEEAVFWANAALARSG